MRSLFPWAKILGYTNGEISRLYIMSTSIVVVLFILISLPLELEIMQILFREMMLTSITGWITFYIDPKIFVEMFVIGVAAYALWQQLNIEESEKFQWMKR